MLFSDLLLVNASLDQVEHRIKPTEYVYSNNLLYEEGHKNYVGSENDVYQWAFLKGNSRKVVSDKRHLHNYSEDIAFGLPDYDQTLGVDHDSCIIRFECNDFDVRNNEYGKFKLRKLKFSSTLSKLMLIYSPYMVINKTNIPLMIGNGSKKNDLEVYPQTSSYF